MTSLEATCVKLRTDGTWAGNYYSAGKTGGPGTNASHPVAAYGAGAAKVISGMLGRSGLLVDQVGFSFTSIKVEGGKLMANGPGGGAIPSGGTGGSPFDDRCPDGTVARGLKGRSGAAIDQIELVCHNPVPAPTAASQMVMASSAMATRLGRPSAVSVTKGSLGTTKDVVEASFPVLKCHGGGVTFGSDPVPGQVMLGAGARVDAQFSIKNLKWNGNYSTSIGEVPYRVSLDGTPYFEAKATNLTSSMSSMAMPSTRPVLSAGRHKLEVEVDPANTLGEDAASRRNNRAEWILEILETRRVRITSLTTDPLKANAANKFKLVVWNDRSEIREFPFRFGVLSNAAESSALRTMPVGATLGLADSWSGSFCSYDAKIWLKHGENVIERPFHKCANSGETKKIVAVLDPRYELGQATSELANDEKTLVATWP